MSCYNKYSVNSCNCVVCWLDNATISFQKNTSYLSQFFVLFFHNSNRKPHPEKFTEKKTHPGDFFFRRIFEILRIFFSHTPLRKCSESKEKSFELLRNFCSELEISRYSNNFNRKKKKKHYPPSDYFGAIVCAFVCVEMTLTYCTRFTVLSDQITPSMPLRFPTSVILASYVWGIDNRLTHFQC